MLSGCAALTNPVANGVPVRILPEELLAESREGYEEVPLSLLRQPPPKEYMLAVGDTLGIYIEGILGTEETAPPVNIPDSSELPPSIGYPFPIRDDGTIALPYAGSVAVAEPALERDITIAEAEERVIAAYRDSDLLPVEDKRILVSLLRPRSTRVLVLREDTSGRRTVTTTAPLGLGFRSTTIGEPRVPQGEIIELPAYQNDVLNALTRTGGMPNAASTLEIVIQRGYWDATSDPTGANRRYPSQADLDDPDGERSVTRIPLQIRPGEPLPFGPQDVILNDGDIVIVRSRDPEYYYTGGLIISSEVPLPLDRDLTVVEAILRARAPFINGGFNASNLNGSVLGAGVGNPSPSQLSVVRKTPMGGQVVIRVDLSQAIRDPRENILVQAEDVLILQETSDEAITRYFTQVLRLNFFTRLIDRGDFQGTATGSFP